METAPLTLAHTIAQRASTAPPKSSSDLIEQHQSAAAEFHNAAQAVDDSEALRVLALLEQHHRRLADIVKVRTTPVASPQPADIAATDTDSKVNPSSSEASATAQKVERQSSTATASSNALSPLRSRHIPRDISSSIASNLATARGIPHQPSTARPRQSSPPGSARALARDLQRGQPVPLTKPSSAVPPQTSDRPVSQPLSPLKNEDSFQKFYSSFGDLVSKLTAPLAFAGLPLHPDDLAPTTSSASAAPLSTRTTTTSDDPAISRLFSRAALRAVQDRHGPSVQESFFVVPTSGGTLPYSSVLAAQDRPTTSRHARTPSTASDAPDHFVDALQTQDQRYKATSPTLSRPDAITRKSSSTKPANNIATSQKTLEELELENASLKQLTDKLSHRLYDWEKNAQNQSIAIQQSILSLNNQRAVPRNSTKREESTSLREDKDMLALEEALAKAQKDLERFGRENEKLKTVVLRYRERWEKLKEGARVRREREDKGGKVEEAKEAQDDEGDMKDAATSEA